MTGRQALARQAHPTDENVFLRSAVSPERFITLQVMTMSPKAGQELIR